MSLPIYELEAELVARLREIPRALVSAPTGSGKSTQVPQMLWRHGFLDRGQVVILQPRRLAARLLAARVAEELGVSLGREVGYQVRFESVCGPETRIRFVTEGVLLRQLVQDPELRGVSAVIFDEFHERHLYGDITLARARNLRSDLLLIVMSATLDVAKLAEYLRPCAVLSSEGRVFPVEIEYEERRDERPVWDRAADAAACRAGEGDALVFMPGGYEIHRTIEALRDRRELKGRLLLPLHGELSPREQDEAVARYARPKVVVSTNVAETSLTIDGIRLVVDGGLARIPRHDPHRGINTLFVEKISRASADQRAGRAGRTAPGRCVRLWTERDQANRPPREEPEVRRLDLAEVVLTLLAAGIDDLAAFPWFEAPAARALVHARELLEDLGALHGGRITDLGRRMLAFPLHPRYGRMLLAAQEYGCVRDAALAAALTQGREILARDAPAERASSDFVRLMRGWERAERGGFRPEICGELGLRPAAARQIAPLFRQFLRIAEREGLDIAPSELSEEALSKCLLSGFSDRVARRVDEGTLRCEMVHGGSGVLARESAARSAPLLVAAEVRDVEGKTILSLATGIDPAWLRELYPEDHRPLLHVEYDAGAKRVVAEERTLFRGLVLERRRVESPPLEEAARLLAAEVLSGRLPLHGWDHAVEQWTLRVNVLARACPELGIPPIGEEERRTIVEQLCHGAVAAKEIQNRPVLPLVREWLSAPHRALVERHAPDRIELPNGRRPKLVYAAEGSPHIALRIQDLYDVREVPGIAMGRVTPLVHILAPSMRPVQITQDLAGFWREHYPKLKRELQRRYPKHEWR